MDKGGEQFQESPREVDMVMEPSREREGRGGGGEAIEMEEGREGRASIGATHGRRWGGFEGSSYSSIGGGAAIGIDHCNCARPATH